MFIVIINYCFHTFSETLANFNTVSTKEFIETMVLINILMKQNENIFVYFCEYIFTEREIKLDYLLSQLLLLCFFVINVLYCCCLSN